MKFLFGEEHALSARKLSADQNFAENSGLCDFDDLEHHETVVQKDFISGVHFVADVFIGDGDLRFIALYVLCGKGEAVALRKIDFSVFESSDPKFGSLRVP